MMNKEEEKKYVQAWLEQFFTGSNSPRRNGLIPKDIKVAIGSFRNEELHFTEEPDIITIMVERAGDLARLGQYGFIDIVNEKYVKYNENSSPNAVPVDQFRELMFKHIKMLKEEFFDREIADEDGVGAHTSIEDMEAVELWAKLTDQFNVDDLLSKTQDYLEEMYHTYKETFKTESADDSQRSDGRD